jgi:hypothetical protein
MAMEACKRTCSLRLRYAAGALPSWSRPRTVESSGSLHPFRGPLRPHNFAPDARQRPGKRLVRTALCPRLLIRMRPLFKSSQAHYITSELRKRPVVVLAGADVYASPGWQTGCTAALERIPAVASWRLRFGRRPNRPSSAGLLLGTWLRQHSIPATTAKEISPAG